MNPSVQKWLQELTENPVPTINKLILGYAGVSAWAGSSLRECFHEIVQTHAETLDSALVVWFQEHLLKGAPEKTPELVWVDHLVNLFAAIIGMPLPQVAKLFYQRNRDFILWLEPLERENLNPRMVYVIALGSF